MTDGIGVLLYIFSVQFFFYTIVSFVFQIYMITGVVGAVATGENRDIVSIKVGREIYSFCVKNCTINVDSILKSV